MPTLRERLREDPGQLDVLLASILPRVAGDDSPALRARVLAAIDQHLGAAYAWPGNVRELGQCVRRVLLTERCAPDERGAGDASRLVDATGGGAWSAEELLSRYCRGHFSRAQGQARRFVQGACGSACSFFRPCSQAARRGTPRLRRLPRI